MNVTVVVPSLATTTPATFWFLASTFVLIADFSVAVKLPWCATGTGVNSGLIIALACVLVKLSIALTKSSLALSTSAWVASACLLTSFALVKASSNATLAAMLELV